MLRERFGTAMVAMLAGIAPAAGPALAQTAPPAATSAEAPRPHHLHDRFDAANTTHDGHLTLDQAQAGGLRMVARNFSAIDADHRGYVTWEDIRRFVQVRRAERQTKPPGSAT